MTLPVEQLGSRATWAELLKRAFEEIATLKQRRELARAQRGSAQGVILG
jgi:hypothetical protein